MLLGLVKEHFGISVDLNGYTSKIAGSGKLFQILAKFIVDDGFTDLVDNVNIILHIACGCPHR